MAKVKMTIAEAMNNHAVIETLWVNGIEMPTIELFYAVYNGNELGITRDTNCEVELIDSEALEIKIAALQVRLAHLNSVKDLYGVAE